MYNTGKEDLIFIIAYVPIKLIQLENHYMVTNDKDIQDMIPVLESKTCPHTFQNFTTGSYQPTT